MTITENQHATTPDSASVLSDGDSPPTLGDVFELRFEFLSDWHIGSGTGVTGSIDRVIQLDADGLPYLPAKTVTGVLRDACERAAIALDGANGGLFANWVEYIFGAAPSGAVRPMASRLAISPARFAPGEIALLTQDERLSSATRLVRASTAIDPATGVAKKGSLRTVEVARKGAVLSARVDVNADLAPVAQAILVAGVALLRRVGGKRRRGLGRCKVTIVSGGEQVDAFAWAKVLQSLVGPASSLAEPPPAVAIEDSAVDFEAGARDQIGRQGSSWRIFCLRLRLDQPLAAQSFRRGNVLETHDFVPGATLVGIVARALGEAGVDARPYIASGSISVGNAVPVVDDVAAIPARLSLAKRKDDPDARVIDRSRTCEEPGTQYTRFPPGWVHPDSRRSIRAADPELCALTHNSVDDRLQRPNAETGGLFTRMAIASGSFFECEVRVLDSVVGATGIDNVVSELVGERFKLGRSKKDDYGSVTVMSVTESAPSAPNSAAREITEHAQIVLLSDVVMRDEYLRPDLSAERLVFEINEHLAVDGQGNGSIALAAPEGVSASRAMQMRRYESWQVSWGLPRPSLVGLRAGSVVTVALNGITIESVIAATFGGVGERRGEGFGRVDVVAFEQQDLPGVPTVEGDGARIVATADRPAVQGTPSAFVRATQDVAWREMIRDAVSTYVNRTDFGTHPNNTQLGGLRQQMLTVVTDADRERAAQWFSHVLEEGRGEWDKFTFASEVTRLLTRPDRVWDLLTGSDTWPAVATSGADMRDAFSLHAAVSLIGGVTKHLTETKSRSTARDHQGEANREER